MNTEERELVGLVFGRLAWQADEAEHQARMVRGAGMTEAWSRYHDLNDMATMLGSALHAE